MIHDRLDVVLPDHLELVIRQIDQVDLPLQPFALLEELIVQAACLLRLLPDHADDIVILEFHFVPELGLEGIELVGGVDHVSDLPRPLFDLRRGFKHPRQVLGKLG